MLKKIAAWSLLAICFAIICFFVAFHGRCIIDADMSSEMVLAKHLADEDILISPGWWYSTELRVFNTQLILMPLFKFFDSWIVIRTLGTAILLAIYLVCYKFLLDSIDCADAFPVSGVFLILPVSTVYFVFVVFGLYYIPHICFSFLLMGLMLKIAANSGKYNVLRCIAMCAVAMMAGMGGLRQLLVYNIPLVVAAGAMSAWYLIYGNDPEKKKQTDKYLILSLLTAIFAFAGYLINSKYLSQRYSFSSYSSINYILPSYERIELIFKEWLAAFGFTEGPAFTMRTLYNVACLCLISVTVYAVINILRRTDRYNLGQRFVTLFFVAASFIYSAFIICTDFAHVGRYCLPVAIFALPVLCIYFCGSVIKDKLTRLFCAVLCALMLLCCFGKLRNQFQTDNTQELRKVTDMLVSEGYTQGYSTFWTGNMVTELSDGKIEMYILSHYIKDLDDIYHWLQEKEHAVSIPEGPIFLLFEDYEFHDHEFLDTLDKEKIVYSSDVYTVYCFDSYEEVMAG